MVSYELSHMKRTAAITFDGELTDANAVMEQLIKKTRVRDMRIKD